MDEQLKPCPFCGEAPHMMVWNDASRPGTDIECVGMDCPTRGCEVCVKGDDHERRAIAAWNTRPVEDALRAEVERLRTAPLLCCAWCGEELSIDTPSEFGGVAMKHLLSCPSHPQRELEGQIAELTAEVERLRTALAGEGE